MPLAADRVIVVTGASHRSAAMSQVGEGVELVEEPSPRDSMAAIGLAAAFLERRDADAVLGSFAADHVIADTSSFAACVREAADLAASQNILVTIGIEPTHAATGFGYIRSGAPLYPGRGGTARIVDEFVEKPDAGTPAKYTASGAYR